MSCLPELFAASRSQNLQQPSKVGGVFSIHLRSAHFNTLKQPTPQEKLDRTSASYSLENKRYRSWTNRQDSFRNSKSSNRTFYKKASFEDGIEETGHAYSNLNNRPTNQSEVEAISSFNIIKRNIFQTVHLSTKIIDMADAEEKAIKKELAELGKNLECDIDRFREDFMQQCSVLTKAFREERRSMLGDGKAISQQLVYLTEQLSTAKSISNELQSRYQGITHQFI